MSNIVKQEQELTPQIVRDLLVRGNKNLVTEQEITLFMKMCEYQGLNPFVNEAYLIKYSQSDPATMTIGYHKFLKRAFESEKYIGHKSGIVVGNQETGEMIEREGTINLKSEKVLGGWAKVFKKDCEPVYISIRKEEYEGRTSKGNLNRFWSKMPNTMCKKVALSQALREAFPKELGGLYTQEEINEMPIEKEDDEIEIMENVVEENIQTNLKVGPPESSVELTNNVEEDWTE